MTEWVIIYKSSNLNDAQIVKSVIEDNEIDVVSLNKMDSMHTHLMNAGIELHIKPDDVINAKYIISKNEL